MQHNESSEYLETTHSQVVLVTGAACNAQYSEWNRSGAQSLHRQQTDTINHTNDIRSTMFDYDGLNKKLSYRRHRVRN